MKTYSDNEIPKHRKKARKKKYALRVYYTLPCPTPTSPFDYFFYDAWVTKYETRKAAENALEAWEKGKGLFGIWKCSERGWAAEIIEL